MKGFIDIHTHILPGTDDGAGDMSQAMDMVRLAYENGTRAIFLTPHYRGHRQKTDPRLLKERFDALLELVGRELPEMRLYLGSEICYEQAAPEALAAKRALSMNGSRYCLLEFLLGSLRSQVLAGVSETVRYGFIPIIAHGERYAAFRKDWSLTDEVLEMGALIQLNASSILGDHGWGTVRFCKRLLKAQKVHFIASDAHDTFHRPPLLRACWWKVYHWCGREYALRLFHDNAQKMILEEVKGEKHG